MWWGGGVCLCVWVLGQAPAGSSVGLEPILGIGYYFTHYPIMVDTFESGFYPSERGWPKSSIGNKPAGQVHSTFLAYLFISTGTHAPAQSIYQS